MEARIEFNIILSDDIRKLVQENCNGVISVETYLLNESMNGDDKLNTLIYLMERHKETLDHNIAILRSVSSTK